MEMPNVLSPNRWGVAVRLCSVAVTLTAPGDCKFRFYFLLNVASDATGPTMMKSERDVLEKYLH